MGILTDLVKKKASDSKAVEYQTYTPGTYTDSDAVKGALNDFNTLKAQEFKDLQLEDFKNSQQTTDAWNQYNNLQGPGDFNFAHQQGWDDIINKINNREPFSYDVNGDALYQQYKDQYINQGKMAMMDTMGQAAAMTGGYGNSYAQSVGQQAYQGHLQQLTDKIPELYSLAMSKYQMEGDDLYKQHGLYTDLFNRDYGMHRDAVADYNADRSHYLDLWGKSHAVDVDKYTINRDNTVAETESYNKNLANKQDLAFKIYTDLRDTDYGRWMDEETLKKLAIEVANENLYRNEQSNQWKKSFDEGVRQFNAQFEENKRQFDENVKLSTTGSANLSDGTVVTAPAAAPKIPDYVTKKLEKGFSTNDALDSYLSSMESQGIISQEQGDTLYETYKSNSLTANDWKLEDDGGWNWWGGMDGNAKVSYGGKKYTIDELYDALRKEGMSKSDAKDYIKKLQKSLGITG